MVTWPATTQGLSPNAKGRQWKESLRTKLEVKWRKLKAFTHGYFTETFVDHCVAVFRGVSGLIYIKILCTYWLSGRAGRENIWLEVRTSWPRAKYFPVRPDLTQSISILSYDHLLLKILKILFEPRLHKIRGLCAEQLHESFYNKILSFISFFASNKKLTIHRILIFVHAKKANRKLT